MGLDQFSERVPLWMADFFNNSSPVGVWQQLGSADNTTGRLDSVMIYNSDAIAHHFSLDMQDDFGGAPMGEVLVPARAGFDGNPPTDLLAAVKDANNHYILSNNVRFRGVLLVETITAGAYLSVQYWGGAF